MSSKHAVGVDFGTESGRAVLVDVIDGHEIAAAIAIHTLALAPDTPAIPRVLLDKHFFRKHGPGAYYGQPPAGLGDPIQGRVADLREEL